MGRLKIKSLKRMSAIALSLMLVSMTGCKSGSSQETEGKKQSQSPIELLQNSEYGYKIEYIEIQKEAENLSTPVLAGNTLYFLNRIDEYEGAVYEEAFSCQLQSIDLSAPEEIKTYDSFFKGEDFVQSFRFLHANKDGGITFLQILFSEKTESTEYHLVRLNADGDVISDVDVSRYFENQIFLYGVYDATRLYVYIQPMPGLETAEQGSHFMLVIDCETGEGEKTEIDCELSTLISLYSGDIAAIVYDIWTGKNTIRLWDKEEKSFSEQEIDFSDNTSYEIEIYPAYEDKFYYIDTGILFLYDLSEQKIEQAIRLLDWNIPPHLAPSLISYIDSDHMLIIAGNAMYQLTRVKASELEQKTEILIGCLGSFENSESIAEFNRKHSEYKIVIKNYLPEDKEYEEIDFDEAVSLLTRDILTGNAPDLIDLSGIDYARYSGSGMFEDLYPYIRQDEEFQNRNLNQTILKLFEEDGALYALPSGYMMKALLASEQQILGEELFTLDKYLEISKSESDLDKKLFPMISREKLLSTLFAYNEDYLIDYKAKTCNFTDGVFEKILMIAKEHQSYENEDDIWSVSAQLPGLASNRQIFFYPMEFYDSITEYQFLEKIFDYQFHITGYPSVEGNKVAVTVAGNLYAISSLSQYKDVCWEFIKQVFDSSYQRAEFQRSEIFPVDNDALEEYFEELKSMVIGYYGNGDVMPIDYIDGLGIYAPTEEEIQQIRELINRVNTLIPNRYTGDVYKILAEEAESFYSGNKTAKEVCKVIQSRVNLLINEN